MHPIDLHFSETMEPYRSLLVSAGYVIVGYSGGADSSCLLHLMQRWCTDKGVILAAAHVNHGIRGTDADRDEEFCRQTCRELDIPFFSTRTDVPSLAAAEKSGIEETARRVRYAFFDEVSEKLTGSASSAIVATAHNADDNLETVLLHLLRGSGLRGLCGIDPLRDGRYLRPLLQSDSDSIRQWCADNGVPFVTDATNADTDYTRNRIRHQILPELRKITPHPTDSVTRLTALLRQDSDYLEAEAAKYTGKTAASRKVLRSLHPAIASRVLRNLYGSAIEQTGAKEKPTLEEKHIRQALGLIGSDTVRAALSLPGKIRIVLERDEIRFQPDTDRQKKRVSPQQNPIKPLFTYPDDGCTFANARYLVCFSQDRCTPPSTIDKLDENIYKLSILTTLRFDKIKDVLQIRYRGPGDTVLCGGMTHKVKRMFADKKLTEQERELCPILYDGDGIVWIPGFPPRDGMVYTGEGEALTICCRTLSDDKSIRHPDSAEG